jgi:hypothetical protein
MQRRPYPAKDGSAGRVGSWLQYHDRSLGRPHCCVAVQLCVDVTPSGPQPRPFLVLGGACRHPSGPADQLDGRFWMCLQVEPPSRLRISPAVHRQGDQVRTVLEIADDHAVIPPGAPPGRRQPQRAPPSRLGTPEPHPAAADTADRAVQRPREADEPARWKTRTSNAFDRHRLIPFRLAASRLRVERRRDRHLRQSRPVVAAASSTRRGRFGVRGSRRRTSPGARRCPST